MIGVDEIFLHRLGSDRASRTRLTSHKANDQWPHLHVGPLWTAEDESDGCSAGGPPRAGVGSIVLLLVALGVSKTGLCSRPWHWPPDRTICPPGVCSGRVHPSPSAIPAGLLGWNATTAQQDLPSLDTAVPILDAKVAYHRME